ncbi:MAG: glucokinase [Woeseia sp.]|jgi:glucokinase|nr:glucokinase [Woeseia sp.]
MTWLIADIGATSSRCGIYSVAGKSTANIQVFRNEDFADLETLLAGYLAYWPEKPDNCALAIAAPLDGDKVQMTNRDWSFSGASIGQHLEFDSIEMLNDFHALAYALPKLDDGDRREVGQSTAYRTGNIAVLGPGSGLGMSAWIDNDGATSVMRGEGGHISIAGRNDVEDTIVKHLRERLGHCFAERILSGPGLLALHEAMHGKKLTSPEEITKHDNDPQCAATLQQFFRFLGSAAADLALISGAYGGVYIAGGIVPACIEEICTSDFRSRFEDKNRYTEYMRAIPTWVITAKEPGLIGLAAYLERRVET